VLTSVSPHPLFFCFLSSLFFVCVCFCFCTLWSLRLSPSPPFFLYVSKFQNPFLSFVKKRKLFPE
jgi:hypothetical protein